MRRNPLHSVSSLFWRTVGIPILRLWVLAMNDILFCLEHEGYIRWIIRRNPDKAAAAAALQQQLGMTESQVRTALQINPDFDKFTPDAIDEVRRTILNTEAILKQKTNGGI